MQTYGSNYSYCLSLICLDSFAPFRSSQQCESSDEAGTSAAAERVNLNVNAFLLFSSAKPRGKKCLFFTLWRGCGSMAGTREPPFENRNRLQWQQTAPAAVELIHHHVAYGCRHAGGARRKIKDTHSKQVVHTCSQVDKQTETICISPSSGYRTDRCNLVMLIYWDTIYFTATCCRNTDVNCWET